MTGVEVFIAIFYLGPRGGEVEQVQDMRSRIYVAGLRQSVGSMAQSRSELHPADDITIKTGTYERVSVDRITDWHHHTTTSWGYYLWKGWDNGDDD